MWIQKGSYFTFYKTVGKHSATGIDIPSHLIYCKDLPKIDPTKSRWIMLDNPELVDNYNKLFK